jgi:hypothetical protein
MNNVLAIIKKHLMPILSGVVAILSVVAVFVWPLPGIYSEFRESVQSRKSTYDELKTVRDKPRTLPQVDPTVTEQPPLTVFPTEAVIAAGDNAVKQIKDDSASTLQHAVSINKQALLVEGSLPAPQPIFRQNFLNDYQAEMAANSLDFEKSIFVRLLRATLPPNERELSTIREQARARILQTKLQIDPIKNEKVNEAEVEELIRVENNAILPREINRRARNYRVYLSPGVAESLYHPAMRGTTPPDETSIFNAQFGLWQMQTLFDAINTVNRDSQSVFDSPLKHVVRLEVNLQVSSGSVAGVSPAFGGGFGGPPASSEFSGPPAGFGGESSGTPAASLAAPVALVADATTPLTLDYTQGVHGHKSNAMYDSFPFVMVVRVDASRTAQVLEKLSAGRFVLVRNVHSMRAVDLAVARAEGYIYSRDSAPITELVIEGEILFLRSWLIPFMPESVKSYFSQRSNPVAPG